MTFKIVEWGEEEVIEVKEVIRILMYTVKALMYFQVCEKNNTLQNHKKLTNDYIVCLFDYILYLLNEYSIFTKLWIS